MVHDGMLMFGVSGRLIFLLKHMGVMHAGGRKRENKENAGPRFFPSETRKQDLPSKRMTE